MAKKLNPDQLEKLFEEDSPEKRIWFKHVVNDYLRVAEALQLKSLPAFEGRMLDMLLIDVVESWVEREGVGPETDHLFYRDELRGLLVTCAKYFMGNVYLQDYLFRTKQPAAKAFGEDLVDHRRSDRADFTAQPRFPRLAWGPIGWDVEPILHMCFIGAASEGLAYFLKSKNLTAPYVKYIELLNILRAAASISVRDRVLNSIYAKTNLFTRRRDIEKEKILAELEFVELVIERPSLLNFALAKGYWSYVFARFLRGVWQFVPLLAASICASWGSIGGAVFFSLWSLQNIIKRASQKSRPIDSGLSIYMKFVNSLYRFGTAPPFLPRPIFEIDRIVKQLVDAGETLPSEVEMLLEDLKDSDLDLRFHSELDSYSPFDGQRLRNSLFRKLSGTSSLAEEVSYKYSTYIPRAET